MSSLWVRVAFSVLLALAVALTIGFGVAMVITGPRPPDTPSLTFRQLQAGSDNTQDTEQLIGVVDRFYQDSYDYRRDYPDYQRNVLVATVLLAMIVGATGIALGATVNFIRLGLTLGAIILLVWAAGFALSAVPNPAPTNSGAVENLLAAGFPPGLDFAGRFLRFASSFIALLVFLFLGLWRLTEWTPAGHATGDSAAVVPGHALSSTGAATSMSANMTTSESQESAPWQRPDGG